MKVAKSSVFWGILLMPAICGSVADAQQPPGNLQLLEGYEHKPLQGIDSRVGKIVHKSGFEIFYEIGRVPKPGAPRLGGDFSDRALQIQERQADTVEWFAKQKVGGQTVHTVLQKDGRWIASFPESGANFSAQTKTKAQLADVLTMVLTYTR